MTDYLNTLWAAYVVDAPNFTAWWYIASQVCTALAFAIGMLAYTKIDDRKLKIILGTSAYANGVHYLLLGRVDGLLLSAVGGTRHIMAGLRPHQSFFALFVILGTALGLWFWHDWKDIFSILANILACVAVYKNSGLRMRWWLVANTFCWFIYAGLTYSALGLLIEGFYIGRNLLTMHRMVKAQHR